MKVVNLEFRDQRQLYRAYMPFLSGGGIFFLSKDKYQLGEKVELALTLPGEAEPVKGISHVCWLSPKTQRYGVRQGFGVNFTPELMSLKSAIESSLGAWVGSSEPTYTM